MLTAKQEAFVQGIIEGKTLVDAYHSAYDTSKMTEKSAYEKASILANQDKIRSRIAELRDKIADDKIMTAQRRLEWLTECIADGNVDINAKLKAIDIMNRMQGEYVQKIAAEVQTETTINIELVDDDEC